ncbi:RICIN domain-containing protein [Streptomyces sp. HD]|nr:RICIN domain-containing protein [Streptomyces sp. HD]MDC0771690.1 RICIN domain-containing protein [Streptomyces sp. HD]
MTPNASRTGRPTTATRAKKRKAPTSSEAAERRADSAAHWITPTTGEGTWALPNAATGRLPDLCGQSTSDGAEIVVWWPNSCSSRRWRVIDVPPTTDS